MNRIMWRIMPLMVAFMMLSVVDRSNVSYAKLQMVSGLGMSETAYGLASSLFFIGSLVFDPGGPGVPGVPTWQLRHLSFDPKYVAYADWIEQHGLLRHLSRALPFLRYRPPSS